MKPILNTDCAMWLRLGRLALLASVASTLNLNAQVITVDNDDILASDLEGANWWYSTSVGGYEGSNYSYNNEGTGTEKIRWRPNITTAGDYKVEVKLVDGRNNRADNAPFTVYHDGGTYSEPVDQDNVDPIWYDLGTHPFAAGTSGYVELTDNANGYVIADMARFTLVAAGGGGGSEVIVDNLDPQPAFVMNGLWNESGWEDDAYPNTDPNDEDLYLWAHSSDYGGAAALVQWRPTLEAGDYEVYVWLPTGGSSRAENAPFTVYHANGSTMYLVPQNLPGGEWVQLDGTFTFNAGTAGYVEMTTDGTNSQYVIADAVKFSSVGSSGDGGGGSSAPVIVTHEEANAPGWWITTSKASTSYNDTNCLINGAGSGGEKMTWIPNLAAGDYKVSIWLPDGHHNRATNVPYTIYDANGAHGPFLLDHKNVSGDGWHDLQGTYTFNDGTSGSVVLADDANGYVVGDAVRFAPASGDGAGGVPVGVDVHWETVQRKGDRGDNWCMTWAADDNIYTMMDDGNGFTDAYGDSSTWNNLMLRIDGGPDFSNSDVTECAGWPKMPLPKGFYGYGTYAVGQRIYTWLWKSDSKWYTRPREARLIYTDDFGESFYRWDGTPHNESSMAATHAGSFFFYREDPVPAHGKTTYAFNWIAFCQNGKANSAAKDDYVYMYAGEQYDNTKLAMIRVDKDQVTNKSAYEYLVNVDSQGNASWSSNMQDRGVTLNFPQQNYNGEDWMWASWHPSVVYNEPLDKYIMVSYGISDDNKPYFDPWCSECSHAATVVMYWADNPWGPWTEFYYQPEWKTPGNPPVSWGFDGEASRTYQFKLNPKWISADGKDMYLIWSDAGGDWSGSNYGHSSYWYRWNQVKITLELEGE